MLKRFSIGVLKSYDSVGAIPLELSDALMQHAEMNARLNTPNPEFRITSAQYLPLRRRLCADIYRHDGAYLDNTTALLRLVMNPRGAFARGAESWPVTVMNRAGRPLASALLMRARRLPDTLQVAFLEAISEPRAALDCLLDEARAQARRCGCTALIVGSNGHVNNGLGLLAGPFGSRPSFGSAYQPPHYVEALSRHAVRTDTLVTYLHDVETFPIAADHRLCERVAKRFRVRAGNFSRLADDIAIYTELNNSAFARDRFYFERAREEDLELFRAFGPLLREENFLVAEYEGRPVGFLLWYPDFNEWSPPGGAVGLGAVWRYRVLRQRPARFKLAEVGVRPEFQKSGAILALVAHCFGLVRGRYKVCESGWILNENALSKALNTRWQGVPDKTYKVFHLDPGGAPA